MEYIKHFDEEIEEEENGIKEKDKQQRQRQRQRQLDFFCEKVLSGNSDKNVTNGMIKIKRRLQRERLFLQIRIRGP